MRRLYCLPCADRWYPERGHYKTPANADDPPLGYRVIAGVAKTPTANQRKITVFTMGKVEERPLPLEHFDCDGCGKPILPGAPCVTVTVWRSADLEPGTWERDYIIEESPDA